MKKISILFLGGAKRVSLAEHFIKAGKKLGLDIAIFSYELDEKVPLASVGTIIKGKKWSDADLFSDLQNQIMRNDISIVLPFVDPAIEVAELLKSGNQNLFIPTCGKDICHIMFDKVLSERWFKEKGLPIPPSFSQNDQIQFPIIVKPRTGSASKGIRVIEDAEEWDKLVNKDNYVIQQFIANREEYTVDCYVTTSGKIISIVPRLRILTAGGEVMNSETRRDKDLIAISEKVLMFGDFKGPVTIQFLRDKKTGANYIMEINPRLGGGVITSIEAGADITEFILCDYLGEELQPCNDWKDKTLMTRYFKEVIFYADNH
jgi:carbamoyl-phosphate synthase large subunit